jgi:hypothetical protein
MRTQHHIIQTAAARMPASCWGSYGRVAVLRVPVTWTAAPRIDDRIKGVEITKVWDRRHRCGKYGPCAGKPRQCAYHRAYAEAMDECDRLNRAGLVTPELG